MPSDRYKKNLRKVMRFARKLAKWYLVPKPIPDCFPQSNVHTMLCQCADCMRDLRVSGHASGQCWDRSTQFNKMYRREANKYGFSLRLGNEPGLHYFSILSMKDRTANVVLDFTFRQFASKSPFPLIMPYGDYYKRWMDGIAK